MVHHTVVDVLGPYFGVTDVPKEPVTRRVVLVREEVRFGAFWGVTGLS